MSNLKGIRNLEVRRLTTIQHWHHMTWYCLCLLFEGEKKKINGYENLYFGSIFISLYGVLIVKEILHNNGEGINMYEKQE